MKKLVQKKKVLFQWKHKWLPDHFVTCGENQPLSHTNHPKVSWKINHLNVNRKNLFHMYQNPPLLHREAIKRGEA